MDTFKPSIDWGSETVKSIEWIFAASAISALCVLLIATLLIRFTTFGRRFWAISGGYFTGSASLPGWGLLAVMLLSVISSVRIQVLLSYYNNDLHSALQTAFEGAASNHSVQRASGIHGFWVAIATFALLQAINIGRIIVDTYLSQRFIIRWRIWLTARFTTNWLGDHVYYRARFVEPGVDNPDQRIQQDIDVFTTGVGTGPNQPHYYAQSMLIFGAVESVVSVASFTVILWKLSGPMTLFGFHCQKALFWIVLGYVLIASLVAFRIGRPLIGYSFVNERTNAAFRYAMVRVRESAEAVAFYRGERAERKNLDTRFGAIIHNYRRYVRRTIGLLGWNFSVTQAIVPLPYIIQAPRLFARSIKLGDVTQSANVFGEIMRGLSFFRNAYSQFASYDAAVLRLYGLVETADQARQLPSVTTESSTDGSIQLDNVEVRTMAGDRLLDPVNVRLDQGESMVITGASGSGKTTLLRSLAELWPEASGVWHRPGGENATIFVSQLPYMPLGSLRTVLCYPDPSGSVPDQRLREVLAQVSLSHLRDQLDVEAEWAKVLSPGEQQRIGFVRVLLLKPKAVFLDEATSALDEGLEFQMYELLRTELPDTVVVSVGHSPAVERHHQRNLALLGNGAWQLSAVARQG
jgi:vitamin B12/bleomycin/antimicrobial peptide transport system ATP-binding/permease protein